MFPEVVAHRTPEGKPGTANGLLSTRLAPVAIRRPSHPGLGPRGERAEVSAVLPHGSSGPPARRRRRWRPGTPDSPTYMFSAARPLAHGDGVEATLDHRIPRGAAPVVVGAPCRTKAQPGNVTFRPE